MAHPPGERRRLRPTVQHLSQLAAGELLSHHERFGRVPALGVPAGVLDGEGGYDVSYISNIDTHADRQGLLRAKAWLSVGHDEYWTQQMYDNVTYARDHGVSLAFLSGNSVSGIVYLNSSTDGRSNRVF